MSKSKRRSIHIHFPQKWELFKFNVHFLEEKASIISNKITILKHKIMAIYWGIDIIFQPKTGVTNTLGIFVLSQ